MVGIVSVVAVAIFVASLGPRIPGAGSGAQAATPPLLKFQLKDKRPARQQLLDFASQVRALSAEPVTGPVLGIAMKGWYLVSGDVTKDYVEPHVVTNYVSDGQLRSFETTCSVRQFRAWRSAAALLTLLANEKDINADGEVVDRSGRRGIGFSVLSDGGGLPTKRTLIFDPATGSILGQEQMLTETAGKMNVLIPR